MALSWREIENYFRCVFSRFVGFLCSVSVYGLFLGTFFLGEQHEVQVHHATEE